jgi:short-subunit dehydrogenase
MQPPAHSPRAAKARSSTCSIVAVMPETLSGTYSGTKAYMLNLSQSMDAELSPLGVNVQAVLPGVTRTEIWERAGLEVSQFPPTMVMEASEMVDASLAGFEQGEVVTVPSLPEMADWQAFTAARTALHPNLSRQHAAARYHAQSH